MSRRYLLEQVEDVSVVQLYADGFADLSIQEKLLAWHLYLAAVAGRDIYYDQRYSWNLELRAALEGILTHAIGLPAHVVDELRRYTKLFWINSGPHNGVTARKQLLRLTPDEWVRAVVAAAAGGAPLATRGGESAAQLALRLAPRLTPRQAPDGGIVDVEVSYPCDLEAQMLEYSSLARA